MTNKWQLFILCLYKYAFGEQYHNLNCMHLVMSSQKHYCIIGFCLLSTTICDNFLDNTAILLELNKNILINHQRAFSCKPLSVLTKRKNKPFTGVIPESWSFIIVGFFLQVLVNSASSGQIWEEMLDGYILYHYWEALFSIYKNDVKKKKLI